MFFSGSSIKPTKCDINDAIHRNGNTAKEWKRSERWRKSTNLLHKRYFTVISMNIVQCLADIVKCGKGIETGDSFMGIGMMIKGDKMQPETATVGQCKIVLRQVLLSTCNLSWYRLMVTRCKYFSRLVPVDFIQHFRPSTLE